jgi:hypothetical protein
VEGFKQHLSVCALSMGCAERERIAQLVADGTAVCSLLRSLKPLGCASMCGSGRELGQTESEFEAMVYCFLRPAGMGTARFQGIVVGRSRGMVRAHGIVRDDDGQGLSRVNTGVQRH